MCLAPTKGCTATFTAGELLRWSVTFGTPEVWVSNNVTRCRNRVPRKMAAALAINHRFSVADSAWTTGMVDRMMREVIRTMKDHPQQPSETARRMDFYLSRHAMVAERCLAATDAVDALSSHAWFPSRTAFTASAEETYDDWQVEPLDLDWLQE